MHKRMLSLEHGMSSIHDSLKDFLCYTLFFSFLTVIILSDAYRIEKQCIELSKTLLLHFFLYNATTVSIF